MRPLIQIRQLSYKQLRTWYAGLTKPRPVHPPYKHIVQIGDPILRNVAEEVPVDLITSPEIMFLVRHMKAVLRHFNSIGLSAPQVGVSLQLFLMEFSDQHAKDYKKEAQQSREMSLMPLTVVFNPSIKITDYTKVTFSETCESVKGFTAEVPRYHSLELKGFNEKAEPIALNLKGWNARVVQHEVDHLNGQVYTDIMERKTLACSCWQIINERRGKVELPYGPE